MRIGLVFKNFKFTKIIFILVIILISISGIQVTSSYFNNSNSISLDSQTRSNQWILSLQANYDNATWFYNHLTNDDRLKIREAMDYAIPREQIINTTLNSFGKTLATYQTP